jgi:hypothetical protein
VTSRFPDIVIFLVVYLVSCKQPIVEPQIPDIYWGECTATLNGESWESYPYSKMMLDRTNFIGIAGNRYNASNLLIEQLNIINIPLAVGTYPLDHLNSQDNPCALYSYTHVDVDLADYFIEEGVPAKGSVTLTEYDSLSREVKGYFDCVLYLVDNSGKPDAPDSLVFKNGYFDTKILE